MRINTNLKILGIALLICVLGILSIYSSNYQKDGGHWQTIYQQQIFRVILGIIVFLFMANINYRRLWDWTYLFYGLCIFLLFLVYLLGAVRLGAQRWLNFAWFNFQPSEIGKLIAVIFLARYFSRKSPDDISLKAYKFGIFKGLVLPFIFVAIPMMLIIEQPDLGSAVMIFFIFVIMLYLSRVKLKYIIFFSAVILAFAPLGWILLREYQKTRLLVFINPNLDPLGAGYTVIQSKIAIGSGGFFGKGWLSGTQSQLRFLPEAHTDFIFATFTEEWGLLGACFLLFLYFYLIKQGIKIAEKTSDPFGRLLALGISSLLAIQVFVNVAMNLGVAPVVGLPLPLMSYGGSSLFVTFMALGILANINKTRAVF